MPIFYRGQRAQRRGRPNTGRFLSLSELRLSRPTLQQQTGKRNENSSTAEGFRGPWERSQRSLRRQILPPRTESRSRRPTDLQTPAPSPRTGPGRGKKPSKFARLLLLSMGRRRRGEKRGEERRRPGQAAERKRWSGARGGGEGLPAAPHASPGPAGSLYRPHHHHPPGPAAAYTARPPPPRPDGGRDPRRRGGSGALPPSVNIGSPPAGRPGLCWGPRSPQRA